MAPRESERARRERTAASSRRNHHRKKRSRATRPTSSSEESGSARRSNALSADALAQLNRDNVRHQRKPERAKRVRREEYRETIQNPDREHRHDKRKKKRVVSGAIVEEGRARPGLRGGGWSDEGYEKEDFYQKPTPKRRRKKYCTYLLGDHVDVLTNGFLLRDHWRHRDSSNHCHHCGGCG